WTRRCESCPAHRHQTVVDRQDSTVSTGGLHNDQLVGDVSSGLNRLIVLLQPVMNRLRAADTARQSRVALGQYARAWCHEFDCCPTPARCRHQNEQRPPRKEWSLEFSLLRPYHLRRRLCVVQANAAKSP